MSDELPHDVRGRTRTSELFSPVVLAQIDAFARIGARATSASGIDPTSEECELTWMVAGGTLAQLLASTETMDMLCDVMDDVRHAAIAANLFWSAGISPHPTETRLR